MRERWQSFKKDYLKPWPITKFIFILLITIWLNSFVFATIKIPSRELNKIYSIEENLTYLEIPSSFSLSRSELDAGNLGTVFWRIIFFRSKWDQVCFQDKGSFLRVAGKVFYGAINSSVSYDKGDFFEVKNKECRELPSGDNKFTFTWRFDVGLGDNYSMQINAKETMEESLDVKMTFYYPNSSAWNYVDEMTIIPNVGTYIRPGWVTEILKFLFLFFSTGALLWAWSRTFFLIKYGWDKKESHKE